MFRCLKFQFDTFEILNTSNYVERAEHHVKLSHMFNIVLRLKPLYVDYWRATYSIVLRLNNWFTTKRNTIDLCLREKAISKIEVTSAIVKVTWMVSLAGTFNFTLLFYNYIFRFLTLWAGKKISKGMVTIHSVLYKVTDWRVSRLAFPSAYFSNPHKQKIGCERD